MSATAPPPAAAGPTLYDAFDPERAYHGAALGMDRTADRDGGRWAALAFEAVRETARRHRTFTTDTVLEDHPHLEAIPERRVLGAAMVEAKRDGLIEPTDRYAQSDRVQSHGRPKRCWRSLVARGSPAEAATC